MTAKKNDAAALATSDASPEMTDDEFIKGVSRDLTKAPTLEIPLVKWKKLHPKARSPEILWASVALFARLDGPLVITSGSTYPVTTGVAIEVPENYEAVLRPVPYSKENARGVLLANSGSTVNGRGRGEVLPIFSNISRGAYTIQNGDMVAVLTLRAIAPIALTEVKQFSGEGE